MHKEQRTSIKLMENADTGYPIMGIMTPKEHVMCVL
jgi:hypothetical protein